MSTSQPYGVSAPPPHAAPQTVPSTIQTTGAQSSGTAVASGTIPSPTQATALTTSAVQPAPADPGLNGGPLSTSPLAGVLGSALALAFVLALAWLFLKLLHRASTLRSDKAIAPLQIMQSLALGGRERVLLVRSGEHEYLLGVTPSQVQLLDKRPHTAHAHITHAHATSPSQPLSTVTD